MRPDVDPDLGTLYLVPTPIGDPGDITARAVEVLRSVSAVACEDTRNSLSLFKPLGIEARLLSYHEHNEESRGRQLLDLLLAGEDVAVVSDAGTPLVNDPGYRLVASAIDAGVRVRPLPGANAPITALIGSGLPVHRFQYAGFLPRKAGARQSALAGLAGVAATLVFFEAPHRVLEALRDMLAVLGDRDAAAGRNLTKPDERFLRGPLSGIIAELDSEEQVRGQFTLVVAGRDASSDDAAEELAGKLADALIQHGATPKLATAVIRDVTGLPRNWVYDRVQSVARP
ncbi:16S rRNA (cytidine(1402)-2'-O)-methyltransferase [Actinokineospora bangkokensis]|uniref:Ribosomal RNA small subunit methyltransferase I n=1 Tax=Actinokineospora bangkokensis TaxID=1193682 RepID=A0A1Q9LBX9_9PSEU|nr:16S rRNA (cytidine(1402)-2'-O)-methyltransferase [Actinokineospora bangkokensis]OLR89524.1 16S rRNA (cytidine(1402)-2'-O)-methyltransferase [Actinokineospora bangkokensis]